MRDEEPDADPIARVDLFLNGSKEPFGSVLPPAHVEIDTSKLDDGPHELLLEAHDAKGNIGRRGLAENQRIRSEGSRGTRRPTALQIAPLRLG